MTARSKRLLHPAYVAGIIDGEGSIFCRRRNPHVSVANTDQALMLELARFGGYMHARDPRKGLGTKPSWEWVICGGTAAALLRICEPHLLVKRDKALAALAQFDSIGGTNHAHFAARAREQFATAVAGDLRWAS